MVYVDSMRAQVGRMVMCHMLADSSNELLSMADQIGVARKWLQHAGQATEHFDICQSKRRAAILAGARSITRAELVHIMRAKRASD